MYSYKRDREIFFVEHSTAISEQQAAAKGELKDGDGDPMLPCIGSEAMRWSGNEDSRHNEDEERRRFPLRYLTAYSEKAADFVPPQKGKEKKKRGKKKKKKEKTPHVRRRRTRTAFSLSFHKSVSLVIPDGTQTLQLHYKVSFP